MENSPNIKECVGKKLSRTTRRNENIKGNVKERSKLILDRLERCEFYHF
eukprot:UN06043